MATYIYRATDTDILTKVTQTQGTARSLTVNSADGVTAVTPAGSMTFVYRVWKLNEIPDNTDIEVLMRVKNIYDNASTFDAGPAVRINATGQYVIGSSYLTTIPHRFLAAAGTTVTLTGGTSVGAVTGYYSWYRYRVETDGANPPILKINAWYGEYEDEPAGWVRETTDPGSYNLSTGGSGWASQDTDLWRWTHISVGTAGDSAPDPRESGTLTITNVPNMTQGVQATITGTGFGATQGTLQYGTTGTGPWTSHTVGTWADTSIIITPNLPSNGQYYWKVITDGLDEVVGGPNTVIGIPIEVALQLTSGLSTSLTAAAIKELSLAISSALSTSISSSVVPPGAISGILSLSQGVSLNITTQSFISALLDISYHLQNLSYGSGLNEALLSLSHNTSLNINTQAVLNALLELLNSNSITPAQFGSIVNAILALNKNYTIPTSFFEPPTNHKIKIIRLRVTNP